MLSSSVHISRIYLVAVDLGVVRHEIPKVNSMNGNVLSQPHPFPSQHLLLHMHVWQAVVSDACSHLYTAPVFMPPNAFDDRTVDHERDVTV